MSTHSADGTATAEPAGTRPLSMRVAAGLIAIVAAAALVSGCGSSTHKTAVAGASEVALQPIMKAGANPFMPPVGMDKAGVMPPPAATAPAGGGLPTYEANLPGLYGGTRNYHTCDAARIVVFLEQNPTKAAAWASTLGIQVTQIRDYVSGLTAVLLRTDTRVTNHGYINGVADAIPAVLEAGTAVLVDKYGRPVVKCYCGNPLTTPTPYSSPTYTGTPWQGFEPAHITIINQSTTIIDTFTLYDPTNGMTFTQTPGVNGRSGPYAQPASSSTTTNPSGTTTPQVQPAPAPTPSPTPTPSPSPSPTPSPTPAPTPQQPPSASFSPNPGHQGDTFVLSASGFPANTTLIVTLTRPDGVVEHYSIDTGSNGSGSHTFTNTQKSITGHYSATVAPPGPGGTASAELDVAPAGQ
jgi:hypothetical protein